MIRKIKNMIKTFYCFRHGQTDWNKELKIQGCEADIPLNETGLAQARDIPEFPLDAIYASPMIRAKQTANAYNEKLDLNIIVKEGLKEIDFGAWSGMTWAEVERDYGKVDVASFQSVEDKDDGFKIPKGDVKERAIERFIKALKNIGENSDAENIGIFTHGRLLYFISNKLSTTDEVFPLMDNSEYFEFKYDTETDELTLVEEGK